MKFVKHKEANIELCVSDEVCSARIISEIEGGSYENREMLFARRILAPEDRILELGAGLGFVSTVVVQAINPQFYAAVEADARLIPHIGKTHAKNGVEGVELIQAAFVTDPEQLNQGYVEFGVTNAFWGSGIHKAGDANVTTVKVETRDASAFVRENKINALVSDIEGGELKLLRDLDLSGIDKIILETHPKVYGQLGMNEIFRILGQNDFAYNAPNSAGPVLSFEKIGVGNFSSFG